MGCCTSSELLAQELGVKQPFTPGKVESKYHWGRQLGEGNFAKVYLVTDLKDGEG